MFYCLICSFLFSVLDFCNPLFPTYLLDPCEYAACGKGSCRVDNHQAVCDCFSGYHLVNGRCEDIDECLNNPCHPTASCQNIPGTFACACPEGLLGDPTIGCRAPGECFTENDCPTTAVCENGRCRNPCENDVCGENAVCSVVNHQKTCECAPNSRGDPLVKCTKIECNDKEDCSSDRTCVDFKCVDPCSLENICGKNSKCVTEQHLGVCSCPPGTTGNPQLGCVSIQYCGSDQQCPGGSRCNGGVCSAVCTSSRDCLIDQLCIDNVCQPTCKTNSSCPEFQYCLNNICTQEVRCKADADCEPDETCIVDSNGRAECRNPCAGRVLCSRNSECIARDHVGSCSCKPGFYEDSKGACRKIECNSDNECTKDKFCQDHMCKIACLVGKPCADNAICSSVEHKTKCQCQPGFTGDAKLSCTAIDYCQSNPCGPQAKCRNSRGSYRCTCPAGMVGDAYGSDGCKPPVECLKDSDCPINARCTTENGEPKCKDVCEETVCGPNSECTSENHKSSCKCRPNYKGDAKDLVNGCTPIPVPCDALSDCPPNTYCHEGICKRKYHHIPKYILNLFLRAFFAEKYFNDKIFKFQNFNKN